MDFDDIKHNLKIVFIKLTLGFFTDEEDNFIPERLVVLISLILFLVFILFQSFKLFDLIKHFTNNI